MSTNKTKEKLATG